MSSRGSRPSSRGESRPPARRLPSTDAHHDPWPFVRAPPARRLSRRPGRRDGRRARDDELGGLGDRFTVAFEVSDDHVDCHYNDNFVYSHPQAFAGAHVQSSCQGDKQVPDESCEAHGEVVVYDVSVEHTGVDLTAALMHERADARVAFPGRAC